MLNDIARALVQPYTASESCLARGGSLARALELALLALPPIGETAPAPEASTRTERA